MTKIEMVEAALAELGDASAEAIAAFVRKRYGAKIEPNYIPLFLACIRDKNRLTNARAARGVPNLAST